ncbi:MAG: hypothetical protein EXR71_21115 [Myxococcales bacterium]|nr:hypothetical protein [Myxococcales bacterium]
MRPRGSLGSARQLVPSARLLGSVAVLLAIGLERGIAAECNHDCPDAEQDEKGCCPVIVPKPVARPVTKPPAGVCSAGQSVGPETAGHCCWAGQVWSNARGACLGAPTACPPGSTASGDTCTPALGAPPAPAATPAPVSTATPSPAAQPAALSGRAPTVAAKPTSGKAVANSVESATLGTLRYIPQGTFTMGSPTTELGREADEVEHAVTLSHGFYLMEREVSQAAWLALMGTNPSKAVSCGVTCPVERVSWDDALAFVHKASERDHVTYRLPTEAEWEYAARGGERSVYSASGDADLVGWLSVNSANSPHPACEKARNA